MSHSLILGINDGSFGTTVIFGGLVLLTILTVCAVIGFVVILFFELLDNTNQEPPKP